MRSRPERSRSREVLPREVPPRAGLLGRRVVRARRLEGRVDRAARRGSFTSASTCSSPATACPRAAALLLAALDLGEHRPHRRADLGTRGVEPGLSGTQRRRAGRSATRGRPGCAASRRASFGAERAGPSMLGSRLLRAACRGGARRSARAMRGGAPRAGPRPASRRGGSLPGAGARRAPRAPGGTRSSSPSGSASKASSRSR